MGEPSQEQIDEAIADGLARGVPEDELVRHLATLERMSDEELAAIGVFPPPPPAKVDTSGPPPAKPRGTVNRVNFPSARFL